MILNVTVCWETTPTGGWAESGHPPALVSNFRSVVHLAFMSFLKNFGDRRKHPKPEPFDEAVVTPETTVTVITTAADLILSLCGELSGKLYSFIAESGESAGCDTLVVLRSQVNSLAVVTGSLKQSFVDPLLSVKLVDAKNASLQAHWVALTPCLTYCNETLKRLDDILETVEYCEGRFLVNPITGTKLDL